MTEKIYNLSAGPAMMPPPVLERAQRELLSVGGCGMSVMEISHRSTRFETILSNAESGMRKLLAVPENYRILFLQGGASMQFSMVPINLLPSGGSADYVITGAWGEKALAEARKAGNINVIYTSAENGYRTIPDPAELAFTQNAAYIHYTSNETIEGVEFKYEINAGGTPIVCDASSNILSKPIDIESYALLYAGAQKNIGPSGVTVVIIRDDMLDRVPNGLPSQLDYRKYAENNSMPNTPNTWGIYLIGLVCEWLKSEGGISEIERRNLAKATNLYSAIDASDGFYCGHAERSVRSLMNVTFRLLNEELEEKFCSEATDAGFDGLRGHRSLGGIRASIYNAFPLEGVEALVGFMQDFARRNG
ncbi:MAG TPA: 3-phosphoserine/phosphohydroxythreonine transaminase [Pyrinomonadaceae bacterium]|mgnify:CR=1 FL=1|nr:3-phosphoserine/phosphohydroxythreonine transaminase [Chloracidobacterium sp.]MBP9935590.1 3-phosphoserine/phosphohydroxythreonine transaminase [Pyrinomonadaceae bacterium]MBK7801125.1 3-phosphoserine/phosphohydroxythreonine transaminase [Chloracidobacterium sp.]MBK9436448.1 3-phosphoserine/phosphohydroxythreonine transaminase [Chloracidobacterium sp.]MBK9767317.1 3-phosphoserine/phosphohydroxythreonine transaminase [Chloracidobacterium sp.]